MLQVMIAGASRGIGLGLVGKYLERGATVYAVARDPAASSGLSALAARHGERLHCIACDLNPVAAPERILAALGGVQLDRIVLNAGIAGPQVQDVARSTEAEVAALFVTNAIAPLRLARALRPLLLEGGVMVFTSSIMASLQLNVGSAMPLYSASKAALNSLVLSWSAELGDSRNFSLLALHPGWVQTAMGGAQAELTVDESVTGLVAMIEASAGGRECRFADYRGETLPW